MHAYISILRYLEYTIRILHKALCRHRFHYPFLIVIGLSVPAIHGLEKSVVSLRIEEALFIEARSLELMIHIRCDGKPVLVFHKRKKLPINRLRRFNETIEIDVPCPPCPACFIIGEGIETTGIDVADTIVPCKVKEVSFKPLPTVGESCRCGKPCAGADNDGVRRFDFLFQSCYIFFLYSRIERHMPAETP